MDLISNWKQIRILFNQTMSSSFHYAIATVNADGEPHVTPIGSLMLDKEPGKGIYFEQFPSNLPKNSESNKRVCVLAVNSSRWFWIRSLIGGSFIAPPAIRLSGSFGELRDAKPEEIKRWRKRVKIFKSTKGYEKMWRQMAMVREIHFDKIIPVKIGEMTKKAWANWEH